MQADMPSAAAARDRAPHDSAPAISRSASALETTFDVVIVGSGGGAVTAALVARSHGLSPVIIEKQSKFGGSTSYSGGVLWLPLNPYLREEDSVEKALQYFEATAGNVGPGSSAERKRAYVHNSPELISFLRSFGMEFEHAEWPDYYSDAPGGMAEGRSLIAPLFDLRRLGVWADKVGYSPFLPQLPVQFGDGVRLGNVKTSFKMKVLAVKIGLRLIKAQLLGQKLRAAGVALQGRMLEIALREKIPIWLETKVNRLVTSRDRVIGVEVERDGKVQTILARRAVLLNTGGFSHNRKLRDQHQRFGLDPRWTLSNPGDTGDMIPEVERLGGFTDFMADSWWVPGSIAPDGTPHFHVPSQTAKPHMIVVDSTGKRIGNEACAYMEFGQKMIDSGKPVWVIQDSVARRTYPWGPCVPGRTPEALVEAGYFRRADTIEDLAQQCGIDPVGLRDTIERFNGFARSGLDLDFNRGFSAYNRWNGDLSHTPNACLGTLEKGPFYAVRLCLTDVGTAGGIMADEYGRVVRRDGGRIVGLYATGNLTASVMGHTYLGAGASIGASFIFGYIAAKHFSGANAMPQSQSEA